MKRFSKTSSSKIKISALYGTEEESNFIRFRLHQKRVAERRRCGLCRCLLLEIGEVPFAYADARVEEPSNRPTKKVNKKYEFRSFEFIIYYLRFILRIKKVVHTRT